MTDKDQVRSTEEALSLEQTLRLALEAMKIKQQVTMWANDGDRAKFNKAIKAVEAALEAKDEPVVGTKTWFEDGKVVTQNLYYSDVYTTPPQRKPLTEQQIKEALADMSALQMPLNKLIPAIARAIEAAHGITGDNNG